MKKVKKNKPDNHLKAKVERGSCVPGSPERKKKRLSHFKFQQLTHLTIGLQTTNVLRACVVDSPTALYRNKLR